MSKYFTSVYKNYYDKIELNKNIVANCNSLNEKVTLLDSSVNNCTSYIVSSVWNEAGKNELMTSYLPKISRSTGILKNGVLVNLNKVVELVTNDLYNLLGELKVKDEEYCKIQDKLKQNDMEESDVIYNQGKLDALDKVLINLVKNVDNKILEIKSYNSIDTSSFLSTDLSLLDDAKTKEELLALYKSTHDEDDDTILGRLKAQVEENKLKKIFAGAAGVASDDTKYVTETYGSGSSLDSGNCIDLSILDANWKVVNTKLSVFEYASLAYNKGIRQNSNTERYSDLCLAFSYVHASNLYNGQTGDNAESAYNWNHAGEFYDYFNDNKQETLKTVYEQVSEGKPVIMQVNGNKAGTSRHFVTVVGIKSDVKSADQVQESDLLILDSWDCQLERMDTNTSRFMTTGKDTNKSYSGYYLRIMK